MQLIFREIHVTGQSGKLADFAVQAGPFFFLAVGHIIGVIWASVDIEIINKACSFKSGT